VKIKVNEIRIPAESTVGYGRGIDEDGNEIHWVGDHRPMRQLAEAIESGVLEDTDEFIELDLEDWQILDPHGPIPAELYEKIFVLIGETSEKPLLSAVIFVMHEDGTPAVTGGIRKEGIDWRPMPIELVMMSLREFVERAAP
jgi:hypothetical protein